MKTTCTTWQSGYDVFPFSIDDVPCACQENRLLCLVEGSFLERGVEFCVNINTPPAQVTSVLDPFDHKSI
jgi:hypothetical protein